MSPDFHSGANLRALDSGEGEKQSQKGGGEPLEVDRSGGEEGLNAHVVETSAHGPCQPVPSLRLAVKALGSPAVTSVQSIVLRAPAIASAPGAQQGRVIVDDHQGLGDARRGQAEGGQIAASAIADLRGKEPAMADLGFVGAQDFSLGDTSHGRASHRNGTA